MLAQRRALERESARKAGDYATSDMIRNELAGMGVQLNDKTHTFSLPNGSQGTYDLHKLPSGVAAPPPPAALPAASLAHMPPFLPSAVLVAGDVSGANGVAGASAPSFAYVQQICVDREKARKGADYATSDQIRQKLDSIGVRLEDKSHTFFMPDGSRGSYDLSGAPAAAASLTFAEVQAKCLDRESARKRSDYSTSDSIRNELSRFGVTLEDKTHMFAMPDGTKGSYNLAEVNSPSTGVAVPAVPAAPAAPQAAVAAAAAAAAHHAAAVAAQQAAYAAAYYPHLYPQYAHYAQQAAMQQHQLNPQAAYTAYYQHLQPQPPPPPSGAASDSRAVAGPASSSTESVRAYCLQREEIRKGGDYRMADQMRDKLIAVGVKVDDKTHTFHMTDGRSGSYDLVKAEEELPVPSDGSYESIKAYCWKREEIRKGGDYRTADNMRKKLQALGVKVEDKTHVFVMSDGATGSYDLSVAVVDSAGPAQPVQPAQPAQTTETAQLGAPAQAAETTESVHTMEEPAQPKITVDTVATQSVEVAQPADAAQIAGPGQPSETAPTAIAGDAAEPLAKRARQDE